MNTKSLSALAALLGSALCFVLPFAQSADEAGSSAPKVPESSPLIVGKGEPAQNPAMLSVIVDHRKVLGWISGTDDFRGREVKITGEGINATVFVQEGNAFTWPYRVDKPTTAVFTVQGANTFTGDAKVGAYSV